MKRIDAPREQKLIDIMFDIVMTMHDYPKSFENATREQKAEWVAKQLRGCGFDTIPMGSSWGVLVEKD